MSTLKTMPTIMKKYTVLMLVTASMWLSTHSLADDKRAIEASSHTTQPELAVIQVLSDICPSLLPKSKHAAFQKGINRTLTSMLPGISAPEKALSALKTDKAFTKLVRLTKRTTLKYPKAENTAICNDIATIP